MTTQLEYARRGVVTDQMHRAARMEGIREEVLLRRIASGKLVLMVRDENVLAIGTGCRTKINVNIGTSSEKVDPDAEVEKAEAAERYGAHTISDLSMGGDIDDIRSRIMAATTVPMTTVPVYQAVVENSFEAMTPEDLLKTAERHLREGISSVVLHAGATLEMLESLRRTDRILGMVSKGGSQTAAWMLHNGCENPIREYFGSYLELMREKDAVLSLGNAMRSGCIHDPMDAPQIEEIKNNARLARQANEAGVQVIMEGMGGHVAPQRIPGYVHYHKQIAQRPLFVAGPLPTDIALGHDHVAGAIGAAMAAGAGADYLCYITPAEHLGLPNLEQMKEGLLAYRIAAHVGDTMKFGPGERDRDLAIRRSMLDWEGQFALAIDPDRPREFHPGTSGSCTMCGRYCPKVLLKQYMG
jgi:phosphomethylpyrimidine synthase